MSLTTARSEAQGTALGSADEPSHCEGGKPLNFFIRGKYSDHKQQIVQVSKIYFRGTIMINQKDILSTIQMIQQQHLDIRTVTMGISLLSCSDESIERACDKIYDKICRYAQKLVPVCEDIEIERQIFAECMKKHIHLEKELFNHK